jgi:hypothetical protein
VKWLLNRVRFDKYVDLDINAKNSEGTSTALDIAVDRQTQVNNQEMRNMLCRAGAKRASSLPMSSSKDYFRSRIAFTEKVLIFFFRGKTAFSNDMRNMLLVVAVLLVTVAYQAVLSPPGGFWQDNYIPGNNNQLNITAAAGASDEVSQPPHRVGTVTMRRRFFPLLVAVNTLTFYIPLLLIVLVLPPGLPSVLLIKSLGLFFLSYCISTSITAPLPFYWLHYFLFFSFFLLSNIAFFLFQMWKERRLLWAFLDENML